MRDRERIEAYVRLLADRLCLKDWSVNLLDEPPSDGESVATIEPIEGRKVANLRLCPDWDGIAPDRKRQTLTHELIHCHHAAAWHIVRLDTVKHLGQATYDVLIAAYRRAMEYGTDGLADAVAPLMPAYPEGES